MGFKASPPDVVDWEDMRVGKGVEGDGILFISRIPGQPMPFGSDSTPSFRPQPKEGKR